MLIPRSDFAHRISGSVWLAHRCIAGAVFFPGWPCCQHHTPLRCYQSDMVTASSISLCLGDSDRGISSDSDIPLRGRPHTKPLIQGISLLDVISPSRSWEKIEKKKYCDVDKVRAWAFPFWAKRCHFVFHSSSVCKCLADISSIFSGPISWLLMFFSVTGKGRGEGGGGVRWVTLASWMIHLDYCEIPTAFLQTERARLHLFDSATDPYLSCHCSEENTCTTYWSYWGNNSVF